MRSDILKRIKDRIPESTKERVRRMAAEPFSPFGVILSDELTNWDSSKWELDDYISYAAGEAWNLDEFSERGYIAMKRMLCDLVNPNNEDLSLEEFTKRLSNIYKDSQSNCKVNGANYTRRNNQA